MIIPKTENIKKGWDIWAKEYAQTIETACLPLAMSVISATGFDFKNKVVLECGCGSGAMSSIIALIKFFFEIYLENIFNQIINILFIFYQ